MPPFEDWEAGIVAVVDNMVAVSHTFPRVETQIFGQWDAITKLMLQVRMDGFH